VGLIRKTLAVSTLGAVKYTSRREAQTKAAIAEARLANAQAEAVRAQSTPPAPDTTGLPWWRQPTIGAALQARNNSKAPRQP
jgi:hypothetical protein